MNKTPAEKLRQAHLEEYRRQKIAYSNALLLARSLPEGLWSNVFIEPDKITLTAHNPEQLHAIRSVLRKVFPGYKDNVRMVSEVIGSGVAYYETHIPGVGLTLDMPLSIFPALKPGCHFEKSTTSGWSPLSEFTYVCPVGGQNE